MSQKLVKPAVCRLCGGTHPPAAWAVQQIIREWEHRYLIEDICEHRIGHPNRDWMRVHGKTGEGIHGCDGCCAGGKDAD